MYCGKTADLIGMPFAVMSGVGQGMGVLDGGGDRRRGMGTGSCELYCDEYVFFCLSARISRKPNGWTVPNFLFVLPAAVARNSSDGIAIGYVLPVLMMTSRFHIITLWRDTTRQA